MTEENSIAAPHLPSGTVVVGDALDAGVSSVPAGAIGDYQLVRRIGVGGYGEVWEAIGPGGLQKAVKILNGRFDGRQAEVEQKSLEKMRAVRHPFLLNIERIEIVKGRLIIVSELAEGSLEDRFEELRAQGERGIARDELLGYLRDAADALDFLCEQHGLQHLDVKPANLLRQGNHVKVADFGLIRQVNQLTEQLVSGFTPQYAPPELFQGKPCRNSDQYSLAMVYQILLTGESPFAGRNAAQLVAQHLNSSPNLSPLSPADRPAIARALSKNPRARFDTCRQFVDAVSARTATARRLLSTADESPARTRTAVSNASPDDAAVLKHQADLDRHSPSRPLRPVDWSRGQAGWRPTLFVGIGGVGGRVLQLFRRKLRDRFGEDVGLPSFPLLCVDTDVSALCGASRPTPRTAWNSDESLAIPLRTAAAYREMSAELLEWLSRRWLYNIPRSGHVAGIRPLGRLAFVDHVTQVRETLQERLQKAMADASLRRTQDETGLPCCAVEPEVIVVASIGGGTGSGCALDFGYVARDVFRELRFPGPSLTAILLGGPSGSSMRGIPAANAVACLRELLHYASPGGGYPGDPACGLEMSEQLPYDHIYVTQREHSDNNFATESDLEQVAEYLRCSVTTGASPFFQEHRRDTQVISESNGISGPLRTFSLTNLSGLSVSTPNDGDWLCQAVVRKWIVEDTPTARVAASASPAVAQWARTLLQRLRLEPSHWAAHVGTHLRGDVGRQLEAYCRYLVDVVHRGDSDPQSLERLLRRIESDFTSGDGKTTNVPHPAGALSRVADELTGMLGNAGRLLRHEILALADPPLRSLSGASDALAAVIGRLEQTVAALETVIGGIQADIPSGLMQTGGSRKAGVSQAADADVRAACHKYCVLRFCVLFYERVVSRMRELRDAVAGIADHLALIRRRLRELEREFSQASRGSDRVGEVAALAQALDERLKADTQSRLFARLLDDDGLRIVRESLCARAAEFLKHQTAGKEVRTASSPSESAKSDSLKSGLHPALSGVGGNHRVLAVAPDALTAASLRQELVAQFGDCVNNQTSDAGELLVCCEVAGLDIERVIRRLADSNDEIIETAKNVHTRTDVKWR